MNKYGKQQSTVSEHTKFKVLCPELESNFIIDMGVVSSNPGEDFIKLQQEVEKVVQISTPLKTNELLSIERLNVKAQDVEDEINEIRELMRAYGASITAPVQEIEEITDEELEKLRLEEEKLQQEQERLEKDEEDLSAQLLRVSFYLIFRMRC